MSRKIVVLGFLFFLASVAQAHISKFAIQNINSRQCMTIATSTNSTSLTLKQAICAKDPMQQWRFVNGEGQNSASFYILSEGNAQCLQTAAKGEVKLATCAVNSRNQLFIPMSFEQEALSGQAKRTIYRILSANSLQCLSIKTTGIADLAQGFITQTCDNGLSQKFALKRTGAKNHHKHRGDQNTSSNSGSWTPLPVDKKEKDQKISGVNISWYGFDDNSCETDDQHTCDNIAFPKKDGFPTPHDTTMEDPGTYHNPITLAAAANDHGKSGPWPVGTLFYVPMVHKYFVMEDSCMECEQSWKKHKYHVDLYMGPNQVGGSKLIQCEEALSASNSTIIVNPSEGYPVETQKIYTPGNCTSKHNFPVPSPMPVKTPTATPPPAKTPPDPTPAPAPQPIPQPTPTPSGPFTLVAEWQGACKRAATIDVNLGNSPEAFVRAAYCQINGTEPDAGLVSKTAKNLRTDNHLRRIDVVRSLCKAVGRNCTLQYSNPWLNNPELFTSACAKKSSRDIGAVMAFFFNCPDGANCKMDWANTHAPGMNQPITQLAWENKPTGYSMATNPSFWKQELRDAKYAGLQFVLPDVYGPDMNQQGMIDTLATALQLETDPVKIGLFDDSWAWGQPYFGTFWQTKPDLSNTEQAAKILYKSKWHPFFTKIKPKYWYTVDDHPLIYFYSAGTLQPRDVSAAVLLRMKKMFQADFGVTPFLVVDSAFFEDPDMPDVADGRFTWDPNTINLPRGMISWKRDERKLSLGIAKWDSVGRDRPGEIATTADVLIKGPEQLQKVLQNSEDADLLVLGTWNDLGEGTGINRNYDYYYQGQWKTPSYFMDIVRKANCTN